MLRFLPCFFRWLQLLGLLLALSFARPASAQVYYLDVSSQKLDLPNRALYVEQVIDGRGSERAIGTIYKGLHEKPATVLFRQSLETELTAWLQQQLPQRPTDQAVALCVRQLRVSEVFTNSSLSSAELSVDVYAHLSDGYHFVRSIADHTSSPGTAINTDHALHLARLMQRSLGQLAGADWNPAARRPAQTLAQLATARPTTTRPAILRAALPRRGVYYSLEQFLANQPDTTTQLHLDTVRWSAVRSGVFDPHAPIRTMYGQAGGYARPVMNTPSGWKGTVQLKAKARTAAGDRVAPREVWGFSDGQLAYLRQSNSYRPLTRQGEFYTYVGAAPTDMAASFRRANGSIAGRTATGGMRRDANDGSGEPMVFALDLRTGQSGQFPPPGRPARADTAFLYVYRPLGGAPTAQRLLFNDREVGQLLPGEYLELACPHFGDAVRLELSEGTALVLVPSTTTANYVKLLANSKAVTPWRLVPARQGEAEVDALEKSHK